MRAVILTIFAALAMAGIWMLPALFMGFPMYVPNLDEAKLYLDTGAIAYGDGHYSTMVFAFMTKWIAWDNLMGWTLFSSLSVAAALVIFWWSLRMLFDVYVAWFAIVIFGLMPIYFQEALTLSNYTLSYLFLFLTGVSLVSFFKRQQRWLLVLAGVFFGICLGLKEAFVLFIPWMVVSYVWIFRKQWKTSLIEICIFLAFAGIAVSLPVLPDALGPNKTLSQRLATIFSLEETKPIGEFYPDQYTYDAEREWYEESVLEQRSKADLSFWERMAQDKRLILFHIGEQSVIFSFVNGVWLLLNRIPSLFFVSTIGGVVTWLFIVPGAHVFLRSNRKLFWFLVGLVLTSELIIRFVFHYQRIHIMEYGWIFAVFAALGVVQIGQYLQRYLPSRISGSCFVMAILAVHLLQMNRMELARLYTKSTVPDRLVVAEALKVLPEGSRIVVPTNYKSVPAMSGRDMMIFREATIERLLANGKLREAFDHYGVTHVLRYPDALMRRIVKADPSTQLLEVAEGKGPSVTPMMKYLLHLVR